MQKKTQQGRLSMNDDPWQLWNKEMQRLVYKKFFADEEGQRMLAMLEQRYFYSPVAVPGRSPDFAFLNEGRNDFIRQIRQWGQAEMQGVEPAKQKQLKRKTK